MVHPERRSLLVLLQNGQGYYYLFTNLRPGHTELTDFVSSPIFFRIKLACIVMCRGGHTAFRF